MSLANGIVGSTHSPQQVTWLKADGTPQDLNGATITARIYSNRLGQARDSDGTFTIVDADNGVFAWTYGTNDVAEAGAFGVQFVATYGDGKPDKTLIGDWYVDPAI